MKTTNNFFFILLLCIILPLTTISSQTLDEKLEQLSENFAEVYSQPGVDAMGAALNGGWLNRAPDAEIAGFDIEIAFIGMGGMVDDALSTFTTSGPFRFTRAQAEQLTNGVTNATLRDLYIDEIISRDFTVQISGATITGPKDEHITITLPESVTVTDPNTGMSYTQDFSGEEIDLGFGGALDDVSFFPSVSPQIKVGTVYGTEAIIRFVPTIDIDDLGEFKFFGFGLQHNLDVWMPNPLPFEITVGFLTQSLTLGDFVEIDAASYGINISKTLGAALVSITPYVGLTFETFDFKASYSRTIDTAAGQQDLDISFTAEGANSTRFNLGFFLDIGFFNLMADYNIGKNNAFTGGLSFNF